jgi:hypothetical protein
MDMSRLRRGEMIAAIGGFVLLIVLLFVNWYSAGPGRLRGMGRAGFSRHDRKPRDPRGCRQRDRPCSPDSDLAYCRVAGGGQCDDGGAWDCGRRDGASANALPAGSERADRPEVRDLARVDRCRDGRLRRLGEHEGGGHHLRRGSRSAAGSLRRLVDDGWPGGTGGRHSTLRVAAPGRKSSAHRSVEHPSNHRSPPGNGRAPSGTLAPVVESPQVPGGAAVVC